MNTDFLINTYLITLTLILLCAIVGVFAVVLYFFIRNQFSNIKTLSVTEKNNPIAGVPFYIKKSRLIHETSYLEALATYTLTVKQVIPDPPNKIEREEIIYNGDRTISLSEEMNAEINTFRTNLVAAQKNAGEIDRMQGAIDSFEKLKPYIGQIPTNLAMESNIVKDSVYVDYQTPFYLNKLQPVSGSTELEVDIAADGTLSKTIGKSEDTTLEKLLGFLPMDKIVAQLVPTPTPKLVGVAINYEYSLTVKNSFIRHIWYEEITNSDRSPKDPIVLSDKPKWYRREIVTLTSPETEKPTAKPT